MGILLLVTIMLAAFSAELLAQAPAPPQQQAPATRPAQPPGSAGPAQPAAPAAQPPADTYTYQPDGRRDPFLGLIGTGAEPRTASRGAEGAAGLRVADIAVRGVLQSRGALMAMIQGPDKKTYIVRQGAKFLDGTIKAITPEGLTVVQEVNDPLSLVKQREIHKLLRSLEDAKE